MAAVVIVLLIAAALVVLARVGLWAGRRSCPTRVISLFAWALAAVFLVETVASFTSSREYEWSMYGPVAPVLAVLALVVAGSGGAWRIHRPHQTLLSH